MRQVIKKILRLCNHKKQALLRYNLLFQQVVRVIVPLNTQLSVGNVIEIKISSARWKEMIMIENKWKLFNQRIMSSFDTETSVTSMTVDS